ncbi:MAG: hypothetical protein WCQ48_08130, partial [Chloroflexota bacterium]
MSDPEKEGYSIGHEGRLVLPLDLHDVPYDHLATGRQLGHLEQGAGVTHPCSDAERSREPKSVD